MRYINNMIIYHIIYCFADDLSCNRFSVTVVIAAFHPLPVWEMAGLDI